MFTDSQSALSYIRNPVLEDLRKHIDVILNHVREREHAELVHFEWVPGSSNTADLFTKALARPVFEKHRTSLGLSVAAP